MFYSRRIGLSGGAAVPILGGARLLGRGGGFQVGGLQMRTEDAPLVGAPATDFSVLRLNRDVLSRSRVGAIATRRAPGATLGVADNYSYGADGSVDFLTDLSMSGYWAATETPGLTGLDTSYRAAANWNADRTGLQAEHLFVGDNFNPEVGLVRRSAFRRRTGRHATVRARRICAACASCSTKAAWTTTTIPAGASSRARRRRRSARSSRRATS